MASFYGGKDASAVSSKVEEEFNMHILSGEPHTSNEERAYWNNKVTAYFDEATQTMIFSKTVESDNS